MRWSLLFLVACGGPSLLPDAPVFGDDDAPFFRPDGPNPDGKCVMLCTGVCTDTDNDPMHCGSCTHACPANQGSCAGGTCFTPNATTWAKHYGGADFGNTIASIATDTSGNIYVTGSMTGSIDLGGGTLASKGSTDILVASFTSAGVHRWSKAYGSAQIDQGAGIAVLNNTVYVIADFFDTVDFGGGPIVSAGREDIVVLELDVASGDFQAAQRYGTANSDIGIGIGVDLSGNITIGGFFGQGSLDLNGSTLVGAGQDNGFIASLFSGFGLRWGRLLASTNAADLSSCQALAVDALGNVAAVGAFSGTVNFGAGAVTANGNDAFVASYTADGAPQWSHTFGGPQYDSANAVAIDANGNVFAGGDYHGSVDFGTGPIPSTGIVDGFIVGYSPSGAFRFARHLNAATSGVVSGLSATASGAVIATGHVEGAVDFGTGALAPLGLYDVFVAGFNGGNATFAKRYGGTDYDEGNTVSVAPSGLIAVGGTFVGTADFGTGAISGGTKDNAVLMMIAP